VLENELSHCLWSFCFYRAYVCINSQLQSRQFGDTFFGANDWPSSNFADHANHKTNVPMAAPLELNHSTIIHKPSHRHPLLPWATQTACEESGLCWGVWGVGEGWCCILYMKFSPVPNREYHSSDDWLDVATYWMGLESDVGIKEEGGDVE
jgi:hypothetical protein